VGGVDVEVDAARREGEERDGGGEGPLGPLRDAAGVELETVRPEPGRVRYRQLDDAQRARLEAPRREQSEGALAARDREHRAVRLPRESVREGHLVDARRGRDV